MVPYSPKILENIHSLFLQILLYLDAFESNTTSDWLSQSEVVFLSNLQNPGRKDKECSTEWLINTVPEVNKPPLSNDHSYLCPFPLFKRVF